MADIDETPLPGVGVRHEFTGTGGNRIGVITRHSGRRELIVYDERDPDQVAVDVELSADEARTLAELLGGTSVTTQLQAVVTQVEGLSIDWLPLPAGFAPRSIGDTHLRERTGVSIVAVIRADDAIPAPGSDHELRPGDTVFVTGTVEGIALAVELLAG